MWQSSTPVIVYALFALFTGIPTVTAANLDAVKARGVLDIAVYGEFPPYSENKNGKPQGLDVAVGRALAEKLGVGAKFRLVRADESMSDDLRNNVWKGHYLGGGTADVMLHVPVDPLLAKDNEQVKILAPYHRETIAVARQAALTDVKSLVDLEEEKIGAEKLTLASDYLAVALGGRLRGSMVLFKSVSEATEALRAGAVGAVMGPLGEVEGTLGSDKAAFIVETMRLPGLRFNGWDLGVAVKSSNTELADAVARAMKALHAEGVIRRIFQDHGVTYQPPTRME